MAEKQTIEELEHVIFHKERMEEERRISDAKYADKWVEKFLTGMVIFILIAVLTAFMALVVK